MCERGTRMYAVVVVAVTLAVLAGCDNASFDDPIRTAVRATLQNEDSVSWGKSLTVMDYACIKVTTEQGNSVGDDTFFLRKSAEEEWAILARHEGVACTKEALESASRKDAAEAAANERVAVAVFEKLKSNGFTPLSDLAEFEASGLGDASSQLKRSFGMTDKDCIEFANHLITFGRMAGSMEDVVNRNQFSHGYAEGLAKLDRKVCKIDGE